MELDGTQLVRLKTKHHCMVSFLWDDMFVVQWRKQFLLETAHIKVCGISWPTGSFVLERDISVEFFNLNVLMIWAP